MSRPLLPPSYFLGALVASIGLGVFLPVAAVLSWPWTTTGTVPIAVGITLNLAADHAFKLHATTVRPFEVSTSLVTDGMFRLSRNPMYLGMVLILLGIAVVLGALTPFAVVAAFALLMHYRFVRIEERMLADRFGAEWQCYSARVRRWV
jgi:protein-S-isoprenylcysteine O-methyltransferase Ste14